MDFLFNDDEPSLTPPTDVPAWPVLVVDDDEAVLRLTSIMFGAMSFEGRPLELLWARSGAEARTVLEARPDIAVVLLDVVMETDDAGIETARWIRERPALSAVRIVLRTGQPGRAKEDEIVEQLAIQDYWSKTELTASRSRSRLALQLRAHEDAVSRTPKPLPSWGVQAVGDVGECQRMIQVLAPLVREMTCTLLHTPNGGAVAAFTTNATPPIVRLLEALETLTADGYPDTWTIAHGALSLRDDGPVWTSDEAPSGNATNAGLYLSPRAVARMNDESLPTTGTWTRMGGVEDNPTALPTLRSIAYTSRYVGSDFIGDLRAIKQSSTRNNPSLRLTGVLLAAGDRFVQVLEGPTMSVAHMMRLIRTDSRHEDLEVLYDTTVQTRCFGGWDLQVLSPNTQSKHTEDDMILLMRSYTTAFQPSPRDLLDLVNRIV